MRILCLVVGLFLTLSATSQTNPSNISNKVLKDQPFSLSIFTSDGSISGGNFKSAVDNPERNSFDITFNTDQIGIFNSVVKYEDNGQFFYTTITIEVVESILRPEHDYMQIKSGEVAQLDVLSNDYTSDGSIQLVSLPYVQNGEARIVDGLVEFTPNSGFTGLAYLSYVVRDSKDESETGFATINVLSAGNPFLKEYFLQVGETLDIVVPEQLTLDNFGKTSLGKLNQTQFGAITYLAGENSGNEIITYRTDKTAGGFKIHVFPKTQNPTFVRDDRFFTSSGRTLQFDVFANDLEKKYPIVSKSPELKNTAPNSGKLSYTPPSGFQGVKKFYYEVSDGKSSYIGNIEIVIDNYLPEITKYDFVTRANTPFVVEYPFSADGGTINFKQAPKNGTLRLDPNGFRYSCGTVLGSDFLVYTPRKDFIGADRFEVEYCAADGSCVDLEIDIDVVSSSNDCDCVGPDCAWPGDADGDGRVSVRDLLPIGYHMGENGNSRTESGNTWNALHASDWRQVNNINGRDIKNADSNGDGSIDIKDVDALHSNYSKLRGFVAREALSIKNVPFYAIPRQTSANPGDLLLIDLYVGSEGFPLLESNGLAFNFNIPPNYIQEGSLNFSFAPDAWYGYNNPTIDFIKYPLPGRVEASISRTGRSSIDGYGIIGTFGAIVLDQEGIKPESNRIPIRFDINGGQYLSEDGGHNGLEDYSSTIYLELKNLNEEQLLDVIAYPNPAQQSITFHANNKDEIQNIAFYNSLGQEVRQIRDIKSNHIEVDIVTFPQGFYIAQIETLLGTSLEKIQVIHD